MSFEQPNPEEFLEENKPTFDDRFAKKQNARVAGGIAEITDIGPESLIEKSQKELPVFLAPGWGLSPDVYKHLIENLVEKGGKRIVSVDHPRSDEGVSINESPSLEEADVKKLKELGLRTPEELRKALNILDTLKIKGLEKVDGIAHSEGALNLVVAAVLNPEKFRNLILFAPAGFIGKDNLFRLAQGFSKQSTRAESLKDIPITEKEKETGFLALKSVLIKLLRSPDSLLRSLREVNDLTRSQIEKALEYLHEKGIGISVVSSEDDPVFEREKMEDTMKKGAKENVDEFHNIIGGHGALGDIPDITGPKIIEILNRFKNEEVEKN